MKIPMGQIGQKVVLVVGAGAGVDYGFPTGQGLLDLMVKEERPLPLSPRAIAAFIHNGGFAKDYPTLPYIHMMRNVEERNEAFQSQRSQQMAFQCALRDSGQRSVDAFLGRSEYNGRTYGQIGRAATAYYLMRQEYAACQEHALRGKWYQELFQHAFDWTGRPHPDLKIITFNYDVSLEFAMYLMLYNSYCHRHDLAESKLKELHVHHVYGSTDFNFLRDQYMHRDFDEEIDIAVRWDRHMGEATVRAAQNIRIIGDERAGEDRNPAWKQWLVDAHEVVFLGFGFDETNLKTIGAHVDNPAWRESLSIGLEVKATAYKLGDSGKQRARALLGLTDEQGDFLDCDCETLLREKTIVGTWDPGKSWM